MLPLVTSPRKQTPSLQVFQLLPPKPCGETSLPRRVNIQANSDSPFRIPYSSAPSVKATVWGEPLEFSVRPSLVQVPCRNRDQLHGALKDVSSMCLSTEPGYILLRNVPPGLFLLRLVYPRCS